MVSAESADRNPRLSAPKETLLKEALKVPSSICNEIQKNHFPDYPINDSIGRNNHLAKVQYAQCLQFPWMSAAFGELRQIRACR